MLVWLSVFNTCMSLVYAAAVSSIWQYIKKTSLPAFRLSSHSMSILYLPNLLLVLILPCLQISLKDFIFTEYTFLCLLLVIPTIRHLCTHIGLPSSMPCLCYLCRMACFLICCPMTCIHFWFSLFPHINCRFCHILGIALVGVWNHSIFSYVLYLAALLCPFSFLVFVCDLCTYTLSANSMPWLLMILLIFFIVVKFFFIIFW